MFEQLHRIIKNVKGLSYTGKSSIFVKVINSDDIQELILNLNRVEQLFKKGIDDTDEIIGFYSAYTEVASQGKSFSFGGQTKTKRQGDPIILYDSGDFYRSFKVKVYQDGFTIMANDEKEGGVLLTQKFGDDILGLTGESRNVLITEIKPKILAEVNRQIFK